MKERRFELLNSKQVSEELARSPIAYFSVGSLEHHGQHIPVGFDSLWVHKACLAAAEITGGIVLPTTYWGTGPCVKGIESLPGSLLLSETVIVDLISNVIDQLINQGYKTIIVVTGHNPAVLGKVISKAKENCLKNHADLTGVRIIEPMNFEQIMKSPKAMALASKARPDHAGKFETSLALHLYPRLTIMDNLHLPEGKVGIDSEGIEESNAQLGKEIFDGFVEFMGELVADV
jgi:creatinine amidohydrolase